MFGITSFQTHEHGGDDGEQDDTFAHTETKAICHLKLVLLIFLLLAALGVALAAYFFTGNAENDNFEHHFSDNALKVLDAIGGSLDLTMGAIDSYVIALVSLARFTNMTWPLVSFPNHAVQMAKLRTFSKSVEIKQYHLVPADADVAASDNQTSPRLQWEQYSIENDGWVQDGLNVQQDDQNYHGNIYTEYQANAVIFDNHGNLSYDEEGPFLPVRNIYPICVSKHRIVFLPLFPSYPVPTAMADVSCRPSFSTIQLGRWQAQTTGGSVARLVVAKSGIE